VRGNKGQPRHVDEGKRPLVRGVIPADVGAEADRMIKVLPTTRKIQEEAEMRVT